MYYIILEKARQHKYIRRLGAPGSYEYVYTGVDNYIGKIPRSEFQKKYARSVEFEGNKIWQFPSRYSTPELGKKIEIPKEIRTGKGIEPTQEDLGKLLGAYDKAKSDLDYVIIQDLVDLTGLDKNKVHQNLTYLVKNLQGVMTINRWGQATYFKFKKQKEHKLGEERVNKLKQVKDLKNTSEAYNLGAGLSKEEAIEIWREYKKRLATPHPEDLQEWGNKSFIDQMHRETVEGYLLGGKHPNRSLRPKKIDKLLGL